MLKGKTVLLGVTGSIAAYKIAGLASMLKKQHADITVLMTQNATNFINPITFETLTGNKCLIDTSTAISSTAWSTLRWQSARTLCSSPRERECHRQNCERHCGRHADDDRDGVPLPDFDFACDEHEYVLEPHCAG